MNHHHCCKQVSYLVARYTITLYFDVLLITALVWSTSRGSPLKESVGDLTPFRSHLSKFLTAVGSIFQMFCFLEVQGFKFTSVLFYLFTFRAIKIR